MISEESPIEVCILCGRELDEYQDDVAQQVCFECQREGSRNDASFRHY